MIAGTEGDHAKWHVAGNDATRDSPARLADHAKAAVVGHRSQLWGQGQTAQERRESLEPLGKTAYWLG